MATTLTVEFALGAQVWVVQRATFEAIKLPCRFCRGAGYLRVEGAGGQSGSARCPECNDQRGGEAHPGTVTIAAAPKWAARGPLTVGQIEVKVQAPDPDPDDYHVKREPRDERYMVEETGVGSGSVYRVADLFADRADAEEEAGRRTEAALNGDGWTPRRDEVRAATSFLDHRDVYEHTAEHVRLAEQILAATTPSDTEGGERDV